MSKNNKTQQLHQNYQPSKQNEPKKQNTKQLKDSKLTALLANSEAQLLR